MYSTLKGVRLSSDEIAAGYVAPVARSSNADLLINIGYEMLVVRGLMLSFSGFSGAMSSRKADRASVYSANIRLLAAGVSPRAMAVNKYAARRLAKKFLFA